MANFDFDALEQRLKDISNPISEAEMESYINQLGQLSGDQAEKAKEYIERLKVAKRRAATFDKDQADFEKRLENMSPDEFAQKDAEISENITPDEVDKQTGDLQAFGDKENKAIVDFVTSQAQLEALQRKGKPKNKKAYEKIIKDVSDRVSMGMAQTAATMYYDGKIAELSKQLSDEKDESKKLEIQNQIKGWVGKLEEVSKITGPEDLKKLNIPFNNKDAAAAYMAVAQDCAEKKNEAIKKKFGKSKIGECISNTDKALTKAFGQKYTKVKEIVKKAGPKVLINVAGSMACSAAFGPAGPAVWAGVKCAWIGIESGKKYREEKAKANLAIKDIDIKIAKASGEELKKLQAERAALHEQATAGFGSYVKNHPEVAVQLGVNLFTIGATGALVSEIVDTTNGMSGLYQSLHGVREVKREVLGMTLSRRFVGAGASLLNGISMSSVEAYRAIKDKEHWKEHLWKAAKSFGLGFGGAAAGMLAGELIAKKLGFSHDTGAEKATKIMEGNTPSSNTAENVNDVKIPFRPENQGEQKPIWQLYDEPKKNNFMNFEDRAAENAGATVAENVPYQMDDATHKTIRDLMIRGPKYATKYLEEQGLLSEQDLAAAKANGGVLYSSRLEKILDSGVLKEKDAQALLAEHERVLTPTGYKIPEDQQRWDDYVAAKKAAEEATKNSGGRVFSEAERAAHNPVISEEKIENLKNDPNVSFEDKSKIDVMGGNQAYLSEAGKEDLNTTIEHSQNSLYVEGLRHEDITPEQVAEFKSKTGLDLNDHLIKDMIVNENNYQAWFNIKANNGVLTEAQLNEMKSIDQAFEEYGLTRMPNGMLNYCDEHEISANEQTVENASAPAPENQGSENDGAQNDEPQKPTMQEIFKKNLGVDMKPLDGGENTSAEGFDFRAQQPADFGAQQSGEQNSDILQGEKEINDALKKSEKIAGTPTPEKDPAAETNVDGGDSHSIDLDSHQIPGGGSYSIGEAGNLSGMKKITATNDDLNVFNRQTGLSLNHNEAQGLIIKEKIYEDLLRRQADNETLNAGEQNFMKNFDKELSDKYGITRGEDGKLECCSDESHDEGVAEIEEARRRAEGNSEPVKDAVIQNSVANNNEPVRLDPDEYKDMSDRRLSNECRKIAKEYRLPQKETDKLVSCIKEARKEKYNGTKEVVIINGKDGPHVIWGDKTKTVSINTNSGNIITSNNQRE